MPQLPGRHQTPCVLIVDPDHAEFAQTAGALGTLAIELLHARTAAEALLRAQQKRIDLMLCEAKLPDMEGLELCERLRRVSPTMAMILFTAERHVAPRPGVDVPVLPKQDGTGPLVRLVRDHFALAA